MSSSQRETSGQVDFVCALSGRRITTVPLYVGEQVGDTALLERAQRHVHFERIPVGHPQSNPFTEQHLLSATRKLFLKTPSGLQAVL